MTTNNRNSTAFVNYIEGKHIKDFQVLIDDPEIFYALPGKFERLRCQDHYHLGLSSSP